MVREVGLGLNPAPGLHPVPLHVPTSRYPVVWSEVISDWKREGEKPGLAWEWEACGAKSFVCDRNSLDGVTKLCRFSNNGASKVGRVGSLADPQARLTLNPRQAHTNPWEAQRSGFTLQRVGPGHPGRLALLLIRTRGPNRP